MKAHLLKRNIEIRNWVGGLVLALTCICFPAAWAQGLTIQNGCGGTLAKDMEQIAAPYQQAVAALKGVETGWCAMAAEQDASTPEGAAEWEFVSAAYVLHALHGRKEITPKQRAALQKVLLRVPGLGKPPTRLRDTDTAFYVLARTLAAKVGDAARVTLDGLQQHAPAVHRTLVRRSVRWGDADDN